MPKWVTIRRKEFNRLRDAAAQAAPEGRPGVLETYKTMLANNANIKQNAELAALVRNLPQGTKLYRRCIEPEWGVGFTIDNVTWCATPEEALRVAAKE